MEYLQRGMESRLRGRMAADRLVILEGARATGKTSLIEHARAAGWITDVRSFADSTERLAAQAAPRDYIMGLPHGTAIDEAQLLEEVTLAIKERIDADPTPGQLLLTGSTRLRRNALGGSDPFAGRTGSPLTLRPMTVGERAGQPVNVLDQLFTSDPGTIPVGPQLPRTELISILTRPGLASMLDVDPSAIRERAAGYLASITNLASFESRNTTNVASLARYLAGRTSTPVNISRFHRDLEIARATADSYLAHLEEALVIHRLPGWRSSKDKSETATPKIHFFDVGLATALGRLRPGEVPADLGRLAESFVVGEMLSQAMWSDQMPDLFHWRKNDKNEVDLLAESPDGRVLCIEVKSAEQVTLADFRGIDAFRSAHPDRFHRGFVFYSGRTVLPFGDDRWAIPFAALRDAAPIDDDPMAEILAGISARRAANRSAVDSDTAELIDEAVARLNRLGKSTGMHHSVQTSDRETGARAELIVQRPLGPVVLMHINVNVSASTLASQTHRADVRKSVSHSVDIDNRPAGLVVSALIAKAAETIGDTLIVWDQEDQVS